MKMGKTGFLGKISTYLSRQRLGELLVTTGRITPQDLRSALIKQKETKTPLGELLVQDGLISKWQLNTTLAKQFALRAVAGAVFFTATMSMDQRANAGDIVDAPARISLASAANAAFAPMGKHPDILGSTERKSTELKAFTKWSEMFERFDAELRSGSGDAVLKTWRARLETFKGGDLKSMANNVNALVNEVDYVIDSKTWGKTDYWATPIEFLTRGAGDCEDFAIAKYTALRALGVPENRLRLAVVHDTVKDIPHAVLIVYTDEGSFVLDNQIKTLVSADMEGRYKPIYSINRTAWWLHTAPAATVVASAQ